jgi:hypothetical protein
MVEVDTYHSELTKMSHTDRNRDRALLRVAKRRQASDLAPFFSPSRLSLRTPFGINSDPFDGAENGNIFATEKDSRSGASK